MPQYQDEPDFHSEPTRAAAYAGRGPTLLGGGALAALVITGVVFAGMNLTACSSHTSTPSNAPTTTTASSSAAPASSAAPPHRGHGSTTVITQGTQTITETQEAPSTDTGNPSSTDAGTPSPSTVTVTQSTDTQTVTVGPQRPFPHQGGQ